MTLRIRWVIALVVLAFGVREASAEVQLITSRSDLGGNDYVDWGTAGANFDLLDNPFSVNSNNGLNVTVSMPNSSSQFQRLDESDGSGPWNGNFAVGDHLIWTQGSFQDFVNPIRIEDFGGSPIYGGGAQIQANLGGSAGSFVAKIEAFDSLGNSLGSFTEDGYSNSAHDNSAIFIGILSDTANIDRIEFGLASTSGSYLGDFAINQFSFVTTQATVPEPSTLLMWVVGGLGMMGLAWRRRRAGLSRS